MKYTSNRRCSIKKLLSKISQYSQENICVAVSLLIKLQAFRPDINTGIFLRIQNISSNNYFEEHLQMAAFRNNTNATYCYPFLQYRIEEMRVNCTYPSQFYVCHFQEAIEIHSCCIFTKSIAQNYAKEFIYTQSRFIFSCLNFQRPVIFQGASINNNISNFIDDNFYTFIYNFQIGKTIEKIVSFCSAVELPYR